MRLEISQRNLGGPSNITLAPPSYTAPRDDLAHPSLVPFLKWPGGKRWLVSSHSHLLPRSFGTYIEPFVGAGSVFFHLQPRAAVLGDANAELINAYEAIRTDWRSLSRSLEYRQQRHNDAPTRYYYYVRDRIPTSPTQRASRLIYLNRTCFNGIYRVNHQGKFNVPRGTKNSVTMDSDNFEAMSSLLNSCELVAGDFEPLIERAQRDDFVFCDPPYTVRHNFNGFVKYNEVLFSWADQERLAAALRRAAARGVKVMCTNADHHSIRDLYGSSDFTTTALSRYSRISADKTTRRYCDELIIRANC